MRGGEAVGEARSYGRSAGLLTVALGSAGVLTYGFFAIASHSLDREEYGQIVVLWSAVYITVSTIFRPIEQLLARSVAELEAQGRSVARAVRVAVLIQLGLTVLFVALALVLWGSLEAELFDGRGRFLAVLVGAMVAFGASFVVRGYLAGRRRFGAYAALLVSEAVARLGFALALALGIVEGVDPLALAIAAGPLLALAALPTVIVLERRRGTAKPAEPGLPATAISEGAPEFTLAQGGGFAGAVLVVMLSEQVFLNAGPLVAGAEAGSAAAGLIFNILLVARAPVVLFQAVAASLLPHLTRLRSRGDESDDEAFRLSIRLTLQVVAGLATAASVAVLAVGPQAMEIAFGDKFSYDRLGLAAVAVGMGLYLSGATLSQAVLARGQAGRAAACWAVAAAVFMAWNLLPLFDVVSRIEAGFVLGAGVLCGLLALVYRVSPAARRRAPGPAGSRELDASPAPADEAV